MIAMIAVSWAMSTVISIPPLFGLKDPVVDDDRLYNFTGQYFRHPAALPDSFKPLVIDDAGGIHPSTGNISRWVNGTLTLDTINCVISQNLGYTVFSTVLAFYLPLGFIVAVYLNVYRVARSRIHRRQFNRRREDGRPGGQRDASTIDPDIETAMQPTSIVLRALRSRLRAPWSRLRAPRFRLRALRSQLRALRSRLRAP